MEDLKDVGDKYIVFYKDNRVVISSVFVQHKTNFTSYEGRCYVGFPAYDSLEEAEAELLRYNLCKEEKCGTQAM